MIVRRLSVILLGWRDVFLCALLNEVRMCGPDSCPMSDGSLDGSGRVSQNDEIAARYELFKLSDGVFVYRDRSDMTKGAAESYLCRYCFESGTLAFLQREESVAAITHVCCDCGTVFLERKKPLTGLAMSPWG